jgi:hypothetical protein
MARGRSRLRDIRCLFCGENACADDKADAAAVTCPRCGHRCFMAEDGTLAVAPDEPWRPRA